MVDVSPPLGAFAIIIQVGSNDHIGVAIAIHIPCRAYRPTEPGASLIAFDYPVGQGAQPGGRAVIDVGPPLIGLTVVIEIRPDNHIGVAIAVHIPSRADRDAKFGAGLVALGRPIDAGAQPGR